MDKTSLRFDEIVKGIKSGDSFTRHESVQMLGEINDPRSINILLNLLSDEDIAIREGAINSLVNIGGEDVARGIVNFLREGEIAFLRNIAIEILVKLGTSSMPVLLPLLKDNDNDVLQFAVDIIGLIGDARIKDIGKYFLPLLKHKNPNIRSAAARTLGILKDRTLVSEILDLLNDEEEWVRFSAVEAIGEIAPSGAANILLDIVRKEKGVVAAAAIDAMGKVVTEPKDANLALAVMEGMIRDGIELPFDVVVSILEKARVEDIEEGWKKGFIKYFIAALGDSSRENQSAALKGLAIIRDKTAVPAILKFVNSVKEDDEETLSAAKDAIVKIGDVDSVITGLKDGTKNIMVTLRAMEEMGKVGSIDMLSGLLSKVDSGARRAIISAIKSVAPQASLDTLILALKDSDSHVRGLAAAALGEAKDEKVIPYLFDALLAERYRDIQEAIVEALVHYPTDDVLDNFSSLLFHENNLIKRLALNGLGAIKNPESVPFIIRMLEEDDVSIKKEALNALQGFKEERAMKAIIAALSDADDDVRFVALESLCGCSGDHVARALLSALKDKSMWVRYKACILLGDLKEKDAVEDLIGMLNKDENAVRIVAALALGKIGDERALGALSLLTDDSDPYVKKAAAKAIETIKTGDKGRG